MIRIAIVDDHAMVRAGLRQFFADQTDMRAVAEQLADSVGRGAGDAPPHALLSERELLVFLQLAQGETMGHAAQRLSLSVKNVSTYRSRVMDKLVLASNSELTYYALKNGLVS